MRLPACGSIVVSLAIITSVVTFFSFFSLHVLLTQKNGSTDGYRNKASYLYRSVKNGFEGEVGNVIFIDKNKPVAEVLGHIRGAIQDKIVRQHEQHQSNFRDDEIPTSLISQFQFSRNTTSLSSAAVPTASLGVNATANPTTIPTTVVPTTNPSVYPGANPTTVITNITRERIKVKPKSNTDSISRENTTGIAMTSSTTVPAKPTAISSDSSITASLTVTPTANPTEPPTYGEKLIIAKERFDMFYTPSLLLQKESLLSLEATFKAANERIEAKGEIQQYSNCYKNVNTTGSYYLYNHTKYENGCVVHSVSLKFDHSCGADIRLDQKRIVRDDITNTTVPYFYIKPLLIVAVQRSGTHFMWEMLNRLGVQVHHEGVGADGAVGWIFAVNNMRDNRHFKLRKGIHYYGQEYIINNPQHLSIQRFRKVFHQVRHPLRVISTLVTRCKKWDRYWKWISKLKGFGAIDRSLPTLKRAMLLYVLWNKHIELYADLRFRSEDTSSRDVCSWAGFHPNTCGSKSSLDVVEPEGTGNNASASASANTSRSVTWDLLGKTDILLTNELKVMCIEYGFPLDVDELPQSLKSKVFTA